MDVSTSKAQCLSVEEKAAFGQIMALVKRATELRIVRDQIDRDRDANPCGREARMKEISDKVDAAETAVDQYIGGLTSVAVLGQALNDLKSKREMATPRLISLSLPPPPPKEEELTRPYEKMITCRLSVLAYKGSSK